MADETFSNPEKRYHSQADVDGQIPRLSSPEMQSRPDTPNRIADRSDDFRAVRPYEVSLSRIDAGSAHSSELAAHRPELAAHSSELAAHSSELAAHRPELSEHNPEVVPYSPHVPDAEPSGDQTDGTPNAPQRRRSDPITQSLTLLATMAVMLLIARYAVPQIVEEVRFAWKRAELRAEYEIGTDGLRNVSLDALSDAYEMVTAAVGPSVVHIDVQRRAPIGTAGHSSEILKRLIPIPDQGSGVIVDSAGYLVTNRHVIADGEDITVTLSDGRRFPAVIVGTDSLTDLAVLKVDADQLMPITWGDSDRCRVGSPVWAVGSPFGLDRTVTFGILSGKHRKLTTSTEWQDFMQSDVAVNPGNSGGPLVDARGTLVGINTAIVGDTYQGVSFSVPSNVAKRVYERIRDIGRVDRGWLGVYLASVSDEEIVGENARLRGSRVLQVPDPSTPAALAGLEPGDIILQVDQKPVRDTHHLMQLIGGAAPGDQIALQVHRGGETRDTEVILGSRPADLSPR